MPDNENNRESNVIQASRPATATPRNLFPPSAGINTTSGTLMQQQCFTPLVLRPPNIIHQLSPFSNPFLDSFCPLVASPFTGQDPVVKYSL
jgi:hypothetical protein